MNKNAKQLDFKILAYSVENIGSHGKNRVLVITQSTLGRGFDQKNLFSKRFLKSSEMAKKHFFSELHNDVSFLQLCTPAHCDDGK